MNEYHIPALLKESIDGLKIDPSGIYVDVTFGGGGHSKEILKKLQTGLLIAFDQDSDALNNQIDSSNFFLIHSNFKYIKNFLNFHGVDRVDGILADLGISFHQVDDKERGFSFMSDSLLDMRMNTKFDTTAADILNNYSEEEISDILREYGDLKNANIIAKAIVVERKKKSIKQVGQLLGVLRQFTIKDSENKMFAKVFQALRIELNQEIEALKILLNSSLDLLKPGGRLVVLSYHSIEDRIVKNFIRSGNVEGKIEKDVYGRFDKPFKAINKKVISPDYNEIKNNKRARSAKLRVAERLSR